MSENLSHYFRIRHKDCMKLPRKTYATCVQCGDRDYADFMAYMPTLGNVAYCVQCATHYNTWHKLAHDQSVVERTQKWRDAYRLAQIEAQLSHIQL